MTSPVQAKRWMEDTKTSQIIGEFGNGKPKYFIEFGKPKATHSPFDISDKLTFINYGNLDQTILFKFNGDMADQLSDIIYLAYKTNIFIYSHFDSKVA
jgi:hypothetical protein